jgi:hypothetical protein
MQCDASDTNKPRNQSSLVWQVLSSSWFISLIFMTLSKMSANTAIRLSRSQPVVVPLASQWTHSLRPGDGRVQVLEHFFILDSLGRFSPFRSPTN